MPMQIGCHGDHYRPIAAVESAALTPSARLTNNRLENWMPTLAAAATVLAQE